LIEKTLSSHELTELICDSNRHVIQDAVDFVQNVLQKDANPAPDHHLTAEHP